MPRKAKKTKRKTNTRKQRKNKLGVKNSLVNNINARRRKGKSRSKKKHTIAKKAYKQLKNNWGKKKD